MSYKFKLNENAGDGVRRMAREQIVKALVEIEDAQVSRDDTVHSIRKRCKKIRALLRLARGDLDGDSEVYKRENVCFRDAARSLSDLRDAAALLETYDMLVVETFGKQCNRQRLQNVREELQAHKQNLTGDKAEVDKRIAVCAETFSQALERVDDWPVGEGFDALAPGLEKTYARGRKAMKQAGKDPSTEAFHEWRKRVKYHRYHVRVLRPVWDDVLNAWRIQLHDLSDDLGDDHDLAEFGDTLSAEHGSFRSNRDVQALLGMADRRRAQLQARAFPQGKRMFVEKPKHMVKRFAAYWSASHSDVECGSSKIEADMKVPADE